MAPTEVHKTAGGVDYIQWPNSVKASKQIDFYGSEVF